MGTRDARIDAYIAKSAEFARPILTHLRDAVHSACPAVEETIKWSMPYFTYKGMLCGMAAFKQHVTFGFWKGALITGVAPNSAQGGDAMGNLGKLTTLKDVPSRTVLTRYVKEAMRLNDEGSVVARPKGAPKPAAAVPPELRGALARNRKAAATFESFSPSQRREYVEWVIEAKRDETKAKRVAQAVEWLAEGKQRNWKYQNG
jgi:uncharacterized protein YdeI (YjbR/CyaY-like superfamily)